MTDELVAEMEKWHNILKVCIIMQIISIIIQIILILYNFR